MPRSASPPEAIPAVPYGQSKVSQFEGFDSVMDSVPRKPPKSIPAMPYGNLGSVLDADDGFFDDDVELVGVEAGGAGLESKAHAARLASTDATLGVAQGYKTYFLQNPDGQMNETHSVAAGLDYVGVSPILAHLSETGRVRFEAATDEEVVDALSLTMQKEGLIPALESSHGFVQAFKEAPLMSPDEVIIINQSGRGDKDIFTIADAFGDPEWEAFIQKKAKEYDAR